MNSNQNFLSRCWNGKARLWQAFWICGIAGKILVLGIIAVIGPLIWHGPEDNMLTNTLLGGLLLAYLTFALVSIWRCSPNVGLAPLGALAKVFVVFSILLWIRLAAQAF